MPADVDEGQDHEHDEAGPITTRDVNGVKWVDWQGLSRVCRRAESTMYRHAADDPETFPAGEYLDGRGPTARKWYRLEAAQDYAAHLAGITDANKPAPAARAGDPRELVGVAGIAEEWHLTKPTARDYVNKSVPQWDAGGPGIVPHPDRGRDRDNPKATTPRHWRWFRETLWNHPRPGRGSSGGRTPAKTPQ